MARERNTSVFRPTPPEQLPVIQKKEPRKIIRDQDRESDQQQQQRKQKQNQDERRGERRRDR